MQNGVFNSASRMPPALPGGLIAPGARFTIRGVRLGTAGQTAVNVQWDSHQARAQLLSVSSNEIEGILPLTVPSGEAMITVASAILTSRPFPIRVADSAPGLYSANRRGWGPAAGTHSAVPGRRVTLLATGLGHGRSAKLEIGGRVVAHILSAGPKAGQPGIEEIAFMLPGDVPEGCYVPVVAATPSGVVSNVVTLSIARPGHMCLTPKDWPQPSLNSVPVTAILMLSRFSMLIEARPGDPQVSEQDNAAGLFLSGPPGAPILPIHLQPPAGTCAAMAGEYHPGDSFARLLGLSGCTRRTRSECRRNHHPWPARVPGYNRMDSRLLFPTFKWRPGERFRPAVFCARRIPHHRRRHRKCGRLFAPADRGSSPRLEKPR